jgi:hypothetical protein
LSLLTQARNEHEIERVLDTMTKPRRAPTGLRLFLNVEQQRKWIEDDAGLTDARERSECMEQRFKYVARFEKLLGYPQADDVFEILKLYAQRCMPIPRKTERYYWSVSCLPSTSDKPLARVNASWMELFTLYSDGEGLRGRIILHLSDFTTDRTVMQDRIDEAVLVNCAAAREDIGLAFPSSGDLFVLNVRGATSIRKLLESSRALRAIRAFNLTHMNRGRNAYQASHCYSLADRMLAG